MTVSKPQNSDQDLASSIDNLCQIPGDFALFVDMNSEELQLVLSNSENKIGSVSSESSFVLAPFDSTVRSPILLPVLSLFKGEETLKFLCSLKKTENIQTPVFEFPSEKDNEIQEFNNRYKATYQKAFQKFHSALCSGKFEKLVLSRPFKVRRTRSMGEFFVALLKNYHHSYRFLVKSKNKFFTGATPEVLLRTQQNSIEVMSLAGTMPTKLAATHPWSEKNKKEQELVTDYIVSSLHPVSDNISCETPKTHNAGPVSHLLTMIHANLKPAIALKEVVEKLHPTPAVCGLPKDDAFRFILENEGWDRDFYTGYLGLISKHTAELFVNLRSAVIEGDIACCFGGGGLLKESHFEDEWHETERKISTLKEYL